MKLIHDNPPSHFACFAFNCNLRHYAEDKDGVTPLMAAATHGKDAAVRELLALGADHTIAKSDGMMAVHRAASSAALAELPTGDTSKAGRCSLTLLCALTPSLTPLEFTA